MMRCFDLFCGGGGSSYGARLAGAEIAGGIDQWALATETFSDNFPKARAYPARLEDVDPNQVQEDVGEIDLLLASPECTNHSCARGARPRSEESRATALEILRYAKTLKPRWIVLENVIHMRPWSRYTELLQTLQDLGYQTKEHILDAADFGVPQRRKRLFILGDRERPPPENILRRRGRKIGARAILDKKNRWPTRPLYTDRRAPATIERAERGFSSIGYDTPFLIVYYGSDGAGGWQSLRSPLRTITTVDRFGLVEPSEQGATLRMLQVPELRRAMGFGDDYIVCRGTRRDKIMILGNGVCPPVMQQIVTQITQTA